ncbi:hypothetical protein GGI19_002643 [Coemansia pectinata]|uniref:methylmalonate-semialdehyde dehydrogenase (CoA acylating) n=1 Tax=Coemansia pectinata TaxID=1052879 RepID=A0A9W8H2B5_9FUNG|nr:hypothetical protein GGI19_002643 [Coemansia pectinata]
MVTLCNFVDNQAVPASNNETLDVTSPHTGQTIAQVPLSSSSDVDTAVAAAAKAWPAWAALTVNARSAKLMALHGLLTEHTGELVDLIVSEHGKTRAEALGDVGKGLETLAYAAGAGALGAGQATYVSGGVLCRMDRAALGVVASIVPFNFPFMVPFWTLPLALAMGNTCVLKPSEKVPLTMARVAELAASLLPPGVLNLVHGGGAVAQALIDHPSVAAVTFVGSSPVAEAVHARATARGKRVLALGGAKNHLVALPDCDLEMTARDIVASFAGCAGQRCMAASVLLVVGEQPALIARVVELARALVPGSDGPLAMGPVIDAAAVTRIAAAVRGAAESGAEVLLDGHAPATAFAVRQAESGGFWVGPSVILHRSPKDSALHEEIFGPVLSLPPTALPALLRHRHSVRTAHPSAPQSCIYPNRTIYNVETPDCFFRRFTPDGKYLLAFNRSLSGLLVFRVLTATASAQQLADASAAEGKSEFYHFFQLAWAQSYTTIGESLHRDLCLVSSDNRYIIAVRLCRADLASAPSPPPNTLACIKAMEDITVLVIDIHTGRLVDEREYSSDIIYLSGHNGVSLYADRLCLLSLKYQCLRILRIGPDGHLTDLHEIGWNTSDDDAVLEQALNLREIEAEYTRSAPLHYSSANKRALSASGACIDDSDMPRLAKRQKTPRSSDSGYLARRANGRSLNHPALTPEAMDPGNSRLLALSHTSHNNSFALRRLLSHQNCTPSLDSVRNASYCPHPPLPPRPSRIVPPELRTISGLPIPFVFARSNEAHIVRSQTSEDDDANVNSTAAAADGGVPVQNGVISNASPASALVDSLNPMLPINSDRAAFMPLHTLHRLPPHYRLVFTRALHSANRLDALADSDTLLIEPSLTSVPHSGLKQRLLAALFMRARAKDDCGLALQFFYRSYRQYEGLVLWRAQFLSHTTLLLRFVPLQVATSRSNAQRSTAANSVTVTNSFTLLAEYDIVTTSFGKIWDSTDLASCDEIENRLDVYRAPMASSNNLSGLASAMTPSLANDVYLRDSFESSQLAIRTARSGGPAQAARKALVMLPYAPQCLQESPLLDPSRFKCNLRTRQMIEKYRPANSAPIRFYDRHTGAVKFVLSPLPIYISPLALVGDSEPLRTIQYQTAADDDDEDSPIALTDSLFGVTMRSGAVLLPSGGVDELGLLADNSSSSAALQSTPALAPTNIPLAQQPTMAHHSNSQKSGVAYLFHPMLPLVLSTRSDMSITALPISNIHFWLG